MNMIERMYAEREAARLKARKETEEAWAASTAHLSAEDLEKVEDLRQDALRRCDERFRFSESDFALIHETSVMMTLNRRLGYVFWGLAVPGAILVIALLALAAIGSLAS